MLIIKIEKYYFLIEILVIKFVKKLGFFDVIEVLIVCEIGDGNLNFVFYIIND